MRNPKMTSATSLLFLVIHFACIRAGNSSETFVKLECKTEYHGVYAKYKTPTMSSFPDTNIQENTNVTIYCNSTGGHQKGLILWFDEFGTNCTESAELVAKETDDGLFSLASKFTVLKATSSYTKTTRCKRAQYQWSPGGEGII
ncbi:hypothetical protein J4Q44_G00286200 [Coregonus suidteri]|uniref:Ig-like domain-containing protein n=1 Tax=Coregonus suidteri TaxID=861788 RepID=A0AAN8KZJ0_9TELE